MERMSNRFLPCSWLALFWALWLCHRYSFLSLHDHGCAHRFDLRFVWHDYNRVPKLLTAGGQANCRWNSR
jgi:hypothetical protein